MKKPLTYEQRKQQRLKDNARKEATVSCRESEFLREGLATAATLHPQNYRANPSRYPYNAIEIETYRGFRIKTAAGCGAERLLTIKHHN